MKVVVIYDSVYGNTEKIARAIAGAFSPPDEVGIFRAPETQIDLLKGTDLLIIGSPTQGFRPLPSVQKVIDGIPEETLENTSVAVFDTRVGGKEAVGAGKFIARLGGYAAARMAGSLKKKGAKLVTPPEGFWVNDSKGPLGQGEIERAASWARKIQESLKVHP